MLTLQVAEYDGVVRPSIKGTPDGFYTWVANTWQLKITEWAHVNASGDDLVRYFQAKIWNFSQEDIEIGENFLSVKEGIAACLAAIIQRIGKDFVTDKDALNLHSLLAEWS